MQTRNFSDFWSFKIDDEPEWITRITRRRVTNGVKTC